MDVFNQNDTQAQAIARYLARGSDSGCNYCLGFELEHFVVQQAGQTLVPYLPSADGRPGVQDILERISPFYSKQGFEAQPDGSQHLVALSRPGAVITLEPGAQLEISIDPKESIADIERIYQDFRAELDPVLDEFGYELLTLGYHPTACAFEIPLIPKTRYHHMDHHFQQTGRHGICMMRASASTQVSIDYFCELDCVRKFRVANALGPLLAFATDNSPVFEAAKAGSDNSSRSGLPVPRRMVRMAIWDDVDANRSLTAPWTFDEHFGFASYAETLLAAPAIFQVALDVEGETCPGRGSLSMYTGSASFADVYSSLPFTKSLVEHILSLFFFDARLKGYIEIRIADSLPPDLALAFTALIKGLFYDEVNLDYLAEATRTVDASQIADAKAALRQDGYQALVYQRNAAQWLDELLELAQKSLPTEELRYLEPLAVLIGTRTTLID
jgi:glutamate--cysteine ligase